MKIIMPQNYTKMDPNSLKTPLFTQISQGKSKGRLRYSNKLQRFTYISTLMPYKTHMIFKMDPSDNTKKANIGHVSS